MYCSLAGDIISVLLSPGTPSGLLERPPALARPPGINFYIMIITTTPTIEGHAIKEYKGIVSGEVIFGMNFMKDFFASIHDVFGGRSNSYEKSMLEGRQTALAEMESNAKALGANAIVGVSYGYETMGQNGSMLMVAVSGTAVVIY